MSLIRVAKTLSNAFSGAALSRGRTTLSIASVNVPSKKSLVYSRYFSAQAHSSSSIFNAFFGSAGSSTSANASTTTSKPPTPTSGSKPPSSSSPFSINDSLLASEYETLQKRNFDFGNAPARYAFLLYSLFKSNNALGSLESEIQRIEKEYQENPRFQVLINSVDGDDQEENLSNDQRELGLEVFFESPNAKNFSDVTRGFLSLCAMNGRLDELGNIFNSYEEIKEILSGRTVAVIVSGKEIKPDELAKTTKALQDVFKVKDLKVENQVNPIQSGGFEIFYDDYHLDNSGETQMKEIEEEIDVAVDEYLGEIEEKERLALKTARNMV